jgi:hypothetical protein
MEVVEIPRSVKGVGRDICVRAERLIWRQVHSLALRGDLTADKALSGSSGVRRVQARPLSPDL